jgi:hypothetical protein
MTMQEMQQHVGYGKGVGHVAGYNTANGLLAEPERESRLANPAIHLEEMFRGLQEMNARLSRVADRLLGGAPEAVEKEGQRISSGGLVARYEGLADAYATQLRRLAQVVERIEQA